MMKNFLLTIFDVILDLKVSFFYVWTSRFERKNFAFYNRNIILEFHNLHIKLPDLILKYKLASVQGMCRTNKIFGSSRSLSSRIC